MKSLNAGLIGYKFMGKAHANAFRQVNHFFQAPAKIGLRSICGRDESQVSKAMETLGFDSYDTDWKSLVKRDDIDFVDIAAPGNFHMEMAICAAEHKKHVFCEKPLAFNVKDARKMLKAAGDNGIRHQVGFNYRFAPAVRLAKRLIDEGRIGEIYHFRGQYLQDWIVNPDFPLNWRLDKKIAGSGAHGDINAHLIDLARYLVGDFHKVVGMQKTFIKNRPLAEMSAGLTAKGISGRTGEVTVDDASLFLAEFENGATGTFEATRLATGRKNGMSLEINGSRGSIRFAFERMNELQYYSVDDDPHILGFRTIQATDASHEYAPNWWPVGHILGYEHTFVHEFYEFVQCIVGERNCSPDFHDGMKCNQVLDAVDCSITEGQWINVAEI
ncbi:MAG: Gfo/Idh/MocA family oxidoreductase [Clostridia bacterium]